MKEMKKSGISGWLITGLVFVGLIITAVALVVGSYISAANLGNRTEKQLEAVWVNTMNVRSQTADRIKTAAKVPEMYRDDLQQVVTKALEGRYGAGGSKAVFQWIQEQQLPYDSSLYAKIQQLIESGSKEFQNQQTTMIDVKRGYETNLGYVWRGFWMRLAGYPKVDLAKYKPILLEGVEQEFKSGVQQPITLR